MRLDLDPFDPYFIIPTTGIDHEDLFANSSYFLRVRVVSFRCSEKIRSIDSDDFASFVYDYFIYSICDLTLIVIKYCPTLSSPCNQYYHRFFILSNSCHLNFT